MNEEEIFKEIYTMSQKVQQGMQNYQSKKDKAYRKSMVSILLDGLERENQNKAII